MFDGETEDIARELGQDIGLAARKAQEAVPFQIVTTKLGNDDGIASVPNVIGKATSWSSLKKLAAKEKLGTDLVVQLPYGHRPHSLVLIKTEEDWKKWSDKVAGGELKVTRRINHLPGTLEAVATRHGTLVGPMQLDITGFSELTPYKGGWCGNDAFTRGYARNGALCAPWRGSSATGCTRRAIAASSA